MSSKGSKGAKKTSRAPALSAGGAPPQRDLFADYRSFVFIERSIGEVRDSRKCCEHAGDCTMENRCPCAKKNAEREFEPYDEAGILTDARDKQDHTVLLLDHTVLLQRSMKDAVKLALEAENGFGPLWLTYMF